MQLVLDEFEQFIGVNPFTLIFAWVNLIILYLFLKKLLFKPIKNMIDSRQKEIDDMYLDAETSVKDANGMKAEYEEKISRANDECDEILRSAVRRAQLREEEILKEADAKARLTMERAEEQIRLEKKNALNEVKDEISGMAIDIATAVLERDVNKKDHEQLIDDFIEKLGEDS
jgi:F-type H+-transporting ATPase subunit b